MCVITNGVLSPLDNEDDVNRLLKSPLLKKMRIPIAIVKKTVKVENNQNVKLNNGGIGSDKERDTLLKLFTQNLNDQQIDTAGPEYLFNENDFTKMKDLFIISGFYSTIKTWRKTSIQEAKPVIFNDFLSTNNSNPITSEHFLNKCFE